MKGEFEKRIEMEWRRVAEAVRIALDLGIDNAGQFEKIENTTLNNVSLWIDEARKESPNPQHYSHEPFDKLEPEMILDGFFDAHTFICDVLTWFKKWFGEAEQK